MRSPFTLDQRIDRLVQSTKWVTAGIAAVLGPLILHAIGLWVRRIGQFPLYSLLFAIGAGVVIVLCRTDIVTSTWVRKSIETERRLTQSLLAMLMLNPFRRLIAPYATKHPHAHWLGKGNWVILASPYFLPSASIFLWLLSGLFLPAPFRSFVIGFGVAYHVASVVLQWLHGTNELRRLGRKFAVMFLIPANLMVIGSGYAFALAGFAGLYQFLRDVFAPLKEAWALVAGTL